MARNNKRLVRHVHSIDRKKQPFLVQHDASPRQTVFSVIISVGATLAIVLGFIFISTIVRAHSTTTAPGGSPSSIPVAYGSLHHPKGWCGNTGQAACPAIDPGWFSVSSETPVAVTSAITHSSSFRTMMNQYGYTLLDTPTLVHTLSAKTGISYYDYDHWIVSVVNTSGQRCGVFDFIYDRAHQRMSFSSFGVVTPNDPHAKMAFPYTSSTAASVALQQQHGLAVAPSSQAELVFFPIDPNFRNLNSPVHLWSGGGDSPMNPIWLLRGIDGYDYFVGVDQHVYTQTDLPVAQGTP